MRRVQHRAAVGPGMHVASGRAHLDRGAHQPARGEGDGGRALVQHPGVEHQRGVRTALVLAYPAQGGRRPDLLLPLHEEAYVDRQLASARELAGHVQQREEVALVVGGPARVEAIAANRRLEGRALPGVERPRVLHVVVPVCEHRRGIGPAGAKLTHGHGMATVDRHQPRLAAGPLDPLAQPLARGRGAPARRHPRWTPTGCAATRSARRGSPARAWILPHPSA